MNNKGCFGIGTIGLVTLILGVAILIFGELALEIFCRKANKT